MRVITKVQSKIASKINRALSVGIICIVLSGCGKEIDITPLFGQWKNVSEISNCNNPQSIRIGKYGELVRFMTSTDYFLEISDEQGELCESDCTIRPKDENSGIITYYGGHDRVMYTFNGDNTIVLTGSIEGTFILDSNVP